MTLRFGAHGWDAPGKLNCLKRRCMPRAVRGDVRIDLANSASSQVLAKPPDRRARTRHKSVEVARLDDAIEVYETKFCPGVVPSGRVSRLVLEPQRFL